MSDRTFNILFICTGNSARSILAEALLNHMARGPFKAYSAGSHPAGVVNPYALKTLEKFGVDASAARSKSWNEFAKPDAPALDFVITVCDQAAGEVCPVWPGQPILAHWGAPDPAKATGTDEEIMSQFAKVAALLRHRIDLFLSLPISKLERLALDQAVKHIGQTAP
ncbi:MAG: arsenate reductase ArsC [Limnobacter sp.]|uniref:arsenate reductase ArsC n=1 Tax=Limnobacter sp. TaxID=2003368 RepID=UPI00391B4C3A